MKIVIVYGQNNKGNTYALTQCFLDALGKDEHSVHEVFPKDMSTQFCTGCVSCLYNGENSWPHSEKIQPLVSLIDEADLLIFASACYVLNMTAAMKNFLDHMTYRFMTHRPEEKTFSKQALILSTAAGSGMRKAIRSIKDSLSFWGVGNIYHYGLRIGAPSFEAIDEKRKQKILRNISHLSKKITKSVSASPGLKTRFLFWMMKGMQSANNWNKLDKKHWEDRGWLQGNKPF